MKVTCKKCVNYKYQLNCFMENCMSDVYCHGCLCNGCDKLCDFPDQMKDISERPKYVPVDKNSQ